VRPPSTGTTSGRPSTRTATALVVVPRSTEQACVSHGCAASLAPSHALPQNAAESAAQRAGQPRRWRAVACGVTGFELASIVAREACLPIAYPDPRSTSVTSRQCKGAKMAQ
jgi:hypothetical protein